MVILHEMKLYVLLNQIKIEWSSSEVVEEKEQVGVQILLPQTKLPQKKKNMTIRKKNIR